MKNGLRIDWVLFASAILFFLMGRFMIPRYEEMILAMDEEAGSPWSTLSLAISGVLLVLFILRIIWRVRKSKK